MEIGWNGAREVPAFRGTWSTSTPKTNATQWKAHHSTAVTSGMSSRDLALATPARAHISVRSAAPFRSDGFLDGTVIVNVVPLPTSLSTSICPPCSAMMV